uniref:DNA primase n=1 Tax=Candidatus Kentrum eta TaxID=2126337 RepID=A0A450V9L7_9GAMM|nr:MAG: DNA primase [Candidatus Kentron sp. H]VFK01460.1 MAG: DNA primase [Candidatus Kentron sp. H]VFK05035.1 MAG: DNA primase [Candidatus Kentron sp. H]
MSGRIPQSFIDELLSRIDIAAIVDEYVPLKKKGRDYMANCPFHDEKTPSFTVSNTKQFYHCFGCDAHGSAIGFLMDYAHMGFMEAVRALAERAGMEVPQAAGEKTADFPHLYGILGEVAQFYARQLYDHPASAQAIAYLKHRGLTPSIVSEFGIGYAPPGWNTLLNAFGGTEPARRHLLEAGLTASKEEEGRPYDRPYDRFRNRIIFPIRDGRGRVIGFGGRVLGDGTPKYLNSPETAVFHKGRELYGLYQQTRQSPGTPLRILVVEGYMDVLALAQQGIRYALATLGTATTTEHLNRIYRIASDVVFCFDADTAGRKAAWRALETLLPLLRDGRQASFMFLPEGEDPDSFIRKAGKEGFETELVKAVSLSGFLFEQLLAQVDHSTLDGKARLIELAKPLVSRLPPGAFRELLLSHLAKLSGLERASLDAQLTAKPKPPARPAQNTGMMEKPTSRPTSRAKPSFKTTSLVEKMISLLLHNPQVARPVTDATRLATLTLPGVPLLVEILDLLAANPNMTTGSLIEHFRNREAGQYLAKLVPEGPLVLAEGLERELSDAFHRLSQLLEEQRCDYLVRKSTESPLTEAEKQELRLLLRHTAGNRHPKSD